MTAQRANGEEFPAEVSFGEMVVDQQKVFTGFIRDISEKKRSEEELRNTQAELARMMRVMTIGQLTASIAHEVSQPLSGIIMNASTCLRMLKSDPPNIDGARETAQRTIRDGNRASEVIQRLRTLFTKKQIEVEPLDLNEAAREVIALLSGRTSERQCNSETRIQGSSADCCRRSRATSAGHSEFAPQRMRGNELHRRSTTSNRP